MTLQKRTMDEIAKQGYRQGNSRQSQSRDQPICKPKPKQRSTLQELKAQAEMTLYPLDSYRSAAPDVFGRVARRFLRLSLGSEGLIPALALACRWVDLCFSFAGNSLVCTLVL